MEVDDRRYFVLDASDIYLNNQVYFARMFGLCDDRAAVEAVYKYIITLELGDEKHGGFNPREIPKTEAKQAMQLVSRNPVIDFLQEYVTEQGPVHFYHKVGQAVVGSIIPVKDMHELYVQWIKGQPAHFKALDKTHLGRILRGDGGLPQSTNVYFPCVGGTAKAYTIIFSTVKAKLMAAGIWDEE